MATMKPEKEITALLVIDPYNDFISEEDASWGGEIRNELKPRPGDVVATEHWCSSSLADMDLDVLRNRHGIHNLIAMGLVANTCVEATVRIATELGYAVTVVKRAIASFSGDEMHAALDVNLRITPRSSPRMKYSRPHQPTVGGTSPCARTSRRGLAFPTTSCPIIRACHAG